MDEEASPVERLLSVQEVAELFNVHATTVRTWARAGRLPSVQTTAGRRFPEAAVQAWLKPRGLSLQARHADGSVRRRPG